MDEDVYICLPKNDLLHKYETIFLVFIQYIIPCLFMFIAYFRIGCNIYLNGLGYNINSQSKKKLKVSLNLVKFSNNVSSDN